MLNKLKDPKFISLKAIQNYVLELQEDIEHYNNAVEVLARNEPTTPLEGVMKKLGFDSWDKENG